MSLSVCARARTKNLRSSSCVVSVPSRVYIVEEVTGGSGRGSVRDEPSSRVALTRYQASLPLSRKTADTTERTLLLLQAPGGGF